MGVLLIRNVLGRATDTERERASKHLRDFLQIVEVQSKAAYELLVAGEEREALEKFGDLLWELNRFLYLRTPGLELKWISRFHEVWAEFAPRILRLHVDDDQCLRVAQIFERLHAANGGRFRAPQERTAGLSKEQIANVRFITAAQDWKLKQKENPYEIAREHPEWFEPSRIAADPETSIGQVLAAVGVKPDQLTKRVDYARNGAEFLVKHYGGSAYNLGLRHNHDAAEIRAALVEPDDSDYLGHIGFSYKKADMFIRDMYDFGVWPLHAIEALEVPPDINTMRAALRTGILRGSHPLLTSYLDVYSYQYGLVSDLASRAWRRVWERWGEIPDNHRVEGPAFFDFLLYEILARECAGLVPTKEMQCRHCGSSTLVRARVRTCPNCESTDTWATRARGSQEQFQDLLRRGCDFCAPGGSGTCALEGLITYERWRLSPPKSISRIGGTGWDDGLASDDEGGGGITS